MAGDPKDWIAGIAADLLATPWREFPVGHRAALRVLVDQGRPYVLFRAPLDADLRHCDALVGVRSEKGGHYVARRADLAEGVTVAPGRFAYAVGGDRILEVVGDMYSEITFWGPEPAELLCVLLDLKRRSNLAGSHRYRRDVIGLSHLPAAMSVLPSSAAATSREAATVIQRKWRTVVADPEHPICRRRLRREFAELPV